jgi:hypothetical protein
LACQLGYWGDNSEVNLPSEQEMLLKRIYERAEVRNGCWDVFCWKDGLQLFAETKRRSRDKIRASQRQWLEAAIGLGLPSTSFLVVEWSVREE